MKKSLSLLFLLPLSACQPSSTSSCYGLGPGDAPNLLSVLESGNTVDEAIICPGTYEVSMTLRRGIHLRGTPGEETRILVPQTAAEGSSSVYGIGIESDEEILIEDLTLAGQGQGIGLLIVRSESVTLTNLTVEGELEEGIHIEGGQTLLSNSHITTPGGYALAVISGAQLTVSDTVIAGAEPAGVIVIGSTFEGTGLNISGVEGREDGTSFGIQSAGSEGNETHISLRESTLEGPLDYGLYLGGDSAKLEGLTLSQTSNSCIILDGVKEATITHSAIVDGQGSGILAVAVDSLNISDVAISDLQPSAPTGTGIPTIGVAIAVIGDEDSAEMSQLSIHDVEISNVEGYGFLIKYSDMVLANNTIQNVLGYGMGLEESMGEIQNNTITNVLPPPEWTSSYGIYAIREMPSNDAALIFQANSVSLAQTGFQLENQSASFEGDAVDSADYGFILRTSDSEATTLELNSISASATALAGLYLDSGSMDLSASTFSKNEVAVYLNAGDSRIEDTLFEENGIALYCNGGSASLVEVVFDGNATDQEGCSP